MYSAIPLVLFEHDEFLEAFSFGYASLTMKPKQGNNQDHCRARHRARSRPGENSQLVTHGRANGGVACVCLSRSVHLYMGLKGHNML